MKKLKLTAFAVLSGLIGSIAQAEDPAPGPDTVQLGTWTAPCEMRGMEARCTSTWRPGLGARHIVQEYTIVNAMDETPIFSGRGVYALSDGAIKGVWEDSRGAILNLTGQYDEDGMTVIWVDPGAEIGRSEYAWSDGAFHATDSVLTENGWRDFMTVEYPPR